MILEEAADAGIVGAGQVEDVRGGVEDAAGYGLQLVQLDDGGIVALIQAVEVYPQHMADDALRELGLLVDEHVHGQAVGMQQALLQEFHELVVCEGHADVAGFLQGAVVHEEAQGEPGELKGVVEVASLYPVQWEQRVVLHQAEQQLVVVFGLQELIEFQSIAVLVGLPLADDGLLLFGERVVVDAIAVVLGGAQVDGILDGARVLLEVHRGDLVGYFFFLIFSQMDGFPVCAGAIYGFGEQIFDDRDLGHLVGAVVA